MTRTYPPPKFASTQRIRRKTGRTSGPRHEWIAELVVICEWQKNRAGDTIPLTLKSYEDTNILDLRIWHSAAGYRKPGAIRQLPALVEAMAQAERRAIELGLIEGGTR
jgi:hypothetical protein